MQAYNTRVCCLEFRCSLIRKLCGHHSFLIFIHVNALSFMRRNGANVERTVQFGCVNGEWMVSKSFFGWRYCLYAESHRNQRVGGLNYTYTLLINYMISCQPNTHLNWANDFHRLLCACLRVCICVCTLVMFDLDGVKRKILIMGMRLRRWKVE